MTGGAAAAWACDGGGTVGDDSAGGEGFSMGVGAGVATEGAVCRPGDPDETNNPPRPRPPPRPDAKRIGNLGTSTEGRYSAF